MSRVRGNRKSSLTLGRQINMPSTKTLVIIGGVAALFISLLLIIGLTDPLGLFGGNSDLELKIMDAKVTDQSLDENGNISDETRNIIYTQVNDYAISEGGDDERFLNIHSYFSALISDALDKGNEDFAMTLLFQEYDYFIGVNEEENALKILINFDTSRVSEHQQNNVYRMISETAERLGKDDIKDEYRGKMTEE